MVWRGFPLDGHSDLVRITLLDTRIRSSDPLSDPTLVPGLTCVLEGEGIDGAGGPAHFPDLTQQNPSRSSPVVTIISSQISQNTIHQHQHDEQAQMMYGVRTSIWRSHLSCTAEGFSACPQFVNELDFHSSLFNQRDFHLGWWTRLECSLWAGLYGPTGGSKQTCYMHTTALQLCWFKAGGV